MNDMDYDSMDRILLETQLDVILAQLSRMKDNMKKAQKKWVAKNRSKVNATQKAYYHRHKNNPIYKERKQQHNRCYRERRHLKKIVQEENIKPIHIEEEWEKQS